MNLHDLPENLPVPQDDGACDHLPGLCLPPVLLPATDGTQVEMSALTGKSVLYLYPMTGTPGEALPEGWDETPGARGCTPQACAFRDHQRDLYALGAKVYGVSAQSAARLHLPYPLLSDAAFRLAEVLGLPTFALNGRRFLGRVTLALQDGVIEKVFYPVFPPDKNAAEVAAYLRAHP